jgi:hypothetical protein
VPAPELPSGTGVNDALANYLRTFALWCRNGFADKLSDTVANPGIMLQASDAPPGANPKVFMLQVDSAGTISAVEMPLGSGYP